MRMTWVTYNGWRYGIRICIENEVENTNGTKIEAKAMNIKEKTKKRE